MSLVGLFSVSDARCLFGPPIPSLFSRMAHCFLCWLLLLSILTASPIALVPIDLADLPSLLSSGFYFQGTCWTHSRCLSGNSSNMYPKLNSFPSPSRPVPLWLPVSVMVSPFNRTPIYPGLLPTHLPCLVNYHVLIILPVKCLLDLFKLSLSSTC